MNVRAGVDEYARGVEVARERRYVQRAPAVLVQRANGITQEISSGSSSINARGPWRTLGVRDRTRAVLKALEAGLL